ncbi:unnamed protein product [Rotaria magnacalcarata]|uniref:Uncharacterized protein n=1 Tax=Rotaria magnacalcarata TaxID=392030 RepID=A0A816MIP4_9BILA|nr:unnamed protein product [Rotaria magnacalcarata]CAF1999375.1 unnamed protein product [Rotaria magnacalcarata]CAF2066743.1 unnamed protein product [Rotaria magnacalcarata]CAF2117734.1 unnamed protein product [Rotaria magnacalcarata]CAF3756704.1 unnamed protein product [Rotaria magnacalcarata]
MTTKNTNVELNHVVGCHLLSFLHGMDVINFLEAVNTSNQFWSIAPTAGHYFIELTKIFLGYKRIVLPRTLFERYTDKYYIDDEQGFLVSERYTYFIEPLQRIFIHPCFSTAGFSKLCPLYKTSLFKCYSRILPFNNSWYDADFPLVNYELYRHTIGSERLLNNHEENLFKVSSYFHTERNRNHRTNLKFIDTIDEFRWNLATHFSSAEWLEAIDFSNLHAEVARHICTRIEKYCKKGFHLLEPIGFDGDFNVLMAQEEIPIYYVEQQQYIDDDGEIQIATKEYHRIPA